MGIETAAYIAISYYMAQQAESAQKKAAEAQNKAIQEETIRQYGEMSDEENQITRDAHQQSIQAQADYMKARSQVELQSAATGTYGQSVDLAIEDLNTTQGQKQTDILRERQANMERVNQTARNIQAQSNASMNRSPIKKASILESAAQGYAMGTPITNAMRSGTDAARAVSSGAMRPDAVK